MTKVTKPQIMKELKSLKENQLYLKEEDNRNKCKEFKLGVINKHKNTIDELVALVRPIIDKVDDFETELMEDKDINLYTYYSKSSFMLSLSSYDRAVSYIMDNSNFYRGKFEVYKQSLIRERQDLSDEWDKLITYCKSLPLKELKKYLEDNKIELECIKNEGVITTTTLVVQDINFNKLWTNKEV